MLPFLEPYAAPTPRWLRDLDPATIARGPLPWLDRLAAGALAYPGADLDGSPVRQLNGVLHSYIFMDYMTRPADLEAELTRPRATGTGFAHHRLVGRAGFDPAPVLARAPGSARHPAAPRWATQAPWGLWAVYEDTRPERRGERFSFLFLGTEAHEAMAALFPRRGPAAVVVQEHGFGGNCHPSHAEPILELSRRWERPAELLITGDHPWILPWAPRLTEIGSDLARESMHRNLRVFRLVRDADGEPGAVRFPVLHGSRVAIGPALRRLMPDCPLGARRGRGDQSPAAVDPGRG